MCTGKDIVRKILLTAKKIDVDINILNKEKENIYCNKKCSGCYCAVGWPEDEVCPNCIDMRRHKDSHAKYSYCICEP